MVCKQARLLTAVLFCTEVHAEYTSCHIGVRFFSLDRKTKKKAKKKVVVQEEAIHHQEICARLKYCAFDVTLWNLSF